MPVTKGTLSVVLLSAIALALTLAAATRLSEDRALREWSLTHWAFTYDHGFTKRSLVGETVSHFVQPTDLLVESERAATWLAWLVCLSLVTCFVLPLYRHPSQAQLWFAAAAVTHTATLSHFAYDLGRFDQFGLLLALASIAVALRAPKSPATAVAIIAASLVGVAVHEAYLLIHAPLVLAIWVWAADGTIRTGPIVAAVGMVVVVVLIALAGAPNVSQEDLVSQLKAAHGSWISERSVGVLYASTRADIVRALTMAITPRRVFQYGVLALGLLPTALMLHRTWRFREAQQPRVGPSELAVVLAALAPLTLMAVGIDFARWWALALTNVFVAVAVLLSASAMWRQSWKDLTDRHAVLLVLVIVMSAAVGPLGVAASPFPQVESLIQQVVVSGFRLVRQ